MSLGLPRALDVETAAEVEATAVLVETLGFEWIRALWRLSDFGLTPGDVDWDKVRRNLGDVAPLARDRGCRRYAEGAVRLLGDRGWLWDTAWHVLRDWDEIAGLADRLGRGQVLEPDEVGEVVRRRKRSVERERQVAALVAVIVAAAVADEEPVESEPGARARRDGCSPEPDPDTGEA